MARRDGAGGPLFTRHGNDFARRFSPAVAAITALPGRSFLTARRSSPAATASRCSSSFDISATAAVGVLISFDLIELDGTDLRRERIVHRKARLAKLVRDPHPGIALHEHYEDDGEVVFQDACKLGWEGILSLPPIPRDARCIG